jgi:hypothetical protein
MALSRSSVLTIAIPGALIRFGRRTRNVISWRRTVGRRNRLMGPREVDSELACQRRSPRRRRRCGSHGYYRTNPPTQAGVSESGAIDGSGREPTLPFNPGSRRHE